MKRSAIWALLGVVLLSGCGDRVVTAGSAPTTPATPSYGNGNCPSPGPIPSGTGLALDNGCPPEPPIPTGSPTSIASSPVPTALAGCPSKPALRANQGHVAVDYGDAVQFQGRLYIAQSVVMQHLAGNVGELQFTVGCALGPYNEVTGRQATMRDGDATFLPHGDRVYAENGWPPRCRLVAKDSNGQWHRYVAQIKGGATAC